MNLLAVNPGKEGDPLPAPTSAVKIGIIRRHELILMGKSWEIESCIFRRDETILTVQLVCKPDAEGAYFTNFVMQMDKKPKSAGLFLTWTPREISMPAAKDEKDKSASFLILLPPD